MVQYPIGLHFHCICIMREISSIPKPAATSATDAAPKVGFVSLGCPKALVDSEQIRTSLRAEGNDTAKSYDVRGSAYGAVKGERESAMSNVAIRNLNVNAGEFVVLLGPSGCRKSPLLHSIGGLIDTTGGQLEISGKDMIWADPKDRGIALVFQFYALYPTMNVERNMTFGLRINGAPNLLTAPVTLVEAGAVQRTPGWRNSLTVTAKASLPGMRPCARPTSTNPACW